LSTRRAAAKKGEAAPGSVFYFIFVIVVLGGLGVWLNNKWIHPIVSYEQLTNGQILDGNGQMKGAIQ
jgi:hypothetical protein